MPGPTDRRGHVLSADALLKLNAGGGLTANPAATY